MLENNLVLTEVFRSKGGTLIRLSGSRGCICIKIESDFKNGQKWKSLVSLGKEYTGIPCTTLTTYLFEIISTTPPKKKLPKNEGRKQEMKVQHSKNFFFF